MSLPAAVYLELRRSHKPGSACFRVALVAKHILPGFAKRHKSSQPAFRILMQQLQISLQEDEGDLGGHNVASDLETESMVAE